MVEAIGICEKHQLPLDRNGECEGNHNDIMFVNGPRYFSLINEFLNSLQE